MRSLRRVIGFGAFGLGSVGSLICVAGVLATAWLGITATAVVDDTIGRIVTPINRLDDRLEQAAAAVEDELVDADADDRIRGEARARVAGHLEKARVHLSSTEERIDDLGETLRWWVRLIAVLTALVFLWGLRAQLVLAMRGWRLLSDHRGRSDT